MRNNLKSAKLVATLLAVFSLQQCHADYTNKTFMLPQSHLYNMAMPLTTWHTQINKQKTTKYSPSIELTGFYQRSENRSGVGKYFGIYANHVEQIRDYIWASNQADGQEYLNLDALGSNYIVHYPSNAPTLDGQIKFKPYQQSYGLRFDYNQKLGDFYFRLALPIVHVKNNMNAKLMGTQTSFTGDDADPRAGKYFIDYLRGNLYSDTTDGDVYAQEPLRKAKVSSKSKTGVADIDLSLGYNLIHSKGNHGALYVISSIPCGNKPKGEFLFEPIIGDAKQWSLGLGWDSKFRLLKSKNNSIELLFNLEGRWIYGNTQKRLLGLIDDDGHVANFAQYMLGGKEGETTVFPLANVLTQDVKIDHGMLGQGLLGLAFNLKNFTVDIGYNIFAKQGEKITLKSWQESIYAIANPNYLEEDSFDVTSEDDYANPAETGINITGAIKQTNLDFNSAQTPRQVVNRFYAGLGYACNQWRYPLMLGLGGSYEFVSTNSALQQWAVWGKLGLTF